MNRAAKAVPRDEGKPARQPHALYTARWARLPPTPAELHRATTIQKPSATSSSTMPSNVCRATIKMDDQELRRSGGLARKQGGRKAQQRLFICKQGGRKAQQRLFIWNREDVKLSNVCSYANREDVKLSNVCSYARPNPWSAVIFLYKPPNKHTPFV